MTLPTFPSRTNLKLHNTLVTIKVRKNVRTDRVAMSYGSDSIPVVVSYLLLTLKALNPQNGQTNSSFCWDDA